MKSDRPQLGTFKKIPDKTTETGITIFPFLHNTKYSTELQQSLLQVDFHGNDRDDKARVLMGMTYQLRDCNPQNTHA